MIILRQKGYDFGFSPAACNDCQGKCCRGEAGNIWINSQDIELIAAFLQTNQFDFISKYLTKINNKYTLNERFTDDSFECIFLDSLKKICTIYEVRPRQCRTFPFWEKFKNNPGLIRLECPGIKE